jgi:hypothetical protein
MSTVAAHPQTARDPAGQGGLRWRLAWLEDENAALRGERQRLEAERQQLRGENERLRAERERLRELNERLRGELPGPGRGVRASPVGAPDETGWQVGGVRAWLWAFVGEGSRSTGSPLARATRTRWRCWVRATPGAGTRRLSTLPPLRERHPPDVPCASAAALPRTHQRRGRRAGQDPARRAPHPGAGASTAGRPRRRHPGCGHASRQPPAAGPPGPRTRAPVHLSARAWCAGHQLARRAGHPPRLVIPGR